MELWKCAEHCDFQDKPDKALQNRLVCMYVDYMVGILNNSKCYNRNITSRTVFLEELWELTQTRCTHQGTRRQHHDKRSKERQFQVGESVLVENDKPESKWILETIVEKLGDISYRDQVGGQV